MITYKINGRWYIMETSDLFTILRSETTSKTFLFDSDSKVKDVEDYLAENDK